MTTESKPHRVMKSIGVKLHPYATCEDCGKEWPTNPATREEAKRHAADEDHRVSVVAETIDVYRREAR